ncbi:MAG: DUF58 domain-containing protein [Pseudomonadota bacterium]
MSTIANAGTAQVPRLDRRRVYILPNRYGYLLGTLLFAILLGSINYDNALGYMLTFLLSGLFLISMLHTVRNLLAISLRSIQAENTFVGSPIHCHVTLENIHHEDKINLTLAAEAERSRWFRKRAKLGEQTVAKIPNSGSANATISLAARRRGWIDLPRLKIYSHFPLGVFIAWGYFVHERKCLVYPQAVGSLPLPATSAVISDELSTGGTGDNDFRGLREYTAGQPIKRIAWRSLAKSDELLVKQFTGANDYQLIFDWHHTENLVDVETRLSQLCLWVVKAHETRLAYGLTLPTITIPVASGSAHQHRCLQALAVFEA